MYLHPLKYPGLVLHCGTASKIAAAHPSVPPPLAVASVRGQSPWKFSSNPGDRRGGKDTHILIPTLCTSQVTISFKLHITQLKVARVLQLHQFEDLNFSQTTTRAASLHVSFCTCKNSTFPVSLQQILTSFVPQLQK